MAVPRGFGMNGKSYYSNVAGPRDVHLQFTVNSADTGGLGLTSLKSNGYVEYAFMHTSQTPGKLNGFTNPNPQAGYALICFRNNFNVYLNGYSIQQPALTSTNTTSLTAGHVYAITALGNTTTANWQAVGFPVGLTPAVGAVFVATATVSITGTGTVGLPGVPSSPIVSMVGTPNTTLNNSNIGSNSGAQIIIQFSAPAVTMASYTPAGTNSAPALTMNSYTPAGTNNSATPPIFTGTPAVLTGTVAAPVFTGTPATLTGTVAYAATAPADSTIISLKFSFDGSSVNVDGL